MMSNSGTEKLRIIRGHIEGIQEWFQKLWSWVSIATSSSLDGRSAGKSDRHTIAILIAISISSSSISSPRMPLSNASRASPACCKCLSHRPKLPLPVSPAKNG